MIKIEETSKMYIKPRSGINSDGFEILIKDGDRELFNKRYDYGYTASYKKDFADAKKPYVTDIINDLKSKYNVTDVEVTPGQNIFSGKPVSDKEVDEFRAKYLKAESKRVTESVAHRFREGDIITPEYNPMSGFDDKYELYEVVEADEDYDEYNGYRYIIVPANDHTKKKCMSNPDLEGEDINDGFEIYGFEGLPDDCGFEKADLDALGFIKITNL